MLEISMSKKCFSYFKYLSLSCSKYIVHKELDTTEQLNWSTYSSLTFSRMRIIHNKFYH